MSTVTEKPERSDPLADDETREAAVAYEDARQEFEKERRKAVERHAGDLNALAGDAETMGQLKRLSDQADALRERRDGIVMRRAPSSTARDGTRSIGKAFLDRIGEGKALVSGSSPVPPFFDPAIRACRSGSSSSAP